MSETAIAFALRSDLADAGLEWTIVLENSSTQPSLPFLAVQVVRTGRTDPVLAGGFAVSTGRLMVTAVTAQNIEAHPAEMKADEIAALYPKARRITYSGANGPIGRIVITDPPLVMEGFPDPAIAGWRVPVRIPYETEGL